MNFADGLSRQYAHFDGADDFLRVARGDSAGGFAVQAREHPVEIFGALLRGLLAKPLAQFFRSLRRVGQAFEQRAQIESRARREDRQLAPRAHVFEHFDRAPAIFACGENFLRLDEIHQMMRDAALLRDRNLRGADVEMAIDLRGIAYQNFAAEPFGERIPSADLPEAVGPENHHEPRESLIPKISSSAAAEPARKSREKKGPTTWVRSISLGISPLIRRNIVKEKYSQSR